VSNFIIFVLLFFLSVSCGTKPRPIPVWNGKLFVGDSQREGLVRAQSNEFIPSSSPEFDNHISMSSEDFRSFYTTYVLGCESWGDKTKLSLRPYKQNLDAVSKIVSSEAKE
jgi:hypothetical protein